eukprot:5601764-Pleurochrysis_carterae.AAC.1
MSTYTVRLNRFKSDDSVVVQNGRGAVTRELKRASERVHVRARARARAYLSVRVRVLVRACVRARERERESARQCECASVRALSVRTSARV